MDPLNKSYRYQAGGRRVVLEPDHDVIGVQLDRLEKSQISALEAQASGLQRINDAVALVSKKSLTSEILGDLLDKNAAFPVFAEGGVRVIALPEVRVELPAGDIGASGFKSLGKWLGEHRDQVKVVSEKPDRMVLTPASGYGPDAVNLAYDISRKFKSLAASPRFLRIIPKRGKS